MKRITEFLEALGKSYKLVLETLKVGFQRPFDSQLILDQIYQIGVRSIPLVFIVAVSSGMVMALQFGYGLAKFGGKLYVPKIVSLSIVREMGPVFACLMLAARVSAGITSEIGSMKVSQQIDAIRALGTSPLKKIVFPRLAACMVAIPMLSAAAIIIGVIGGLIVGSMELGLDSQFYLQKIFSTLKLHDFISGFGKSFFFAFFIATTSCYFGLSVTGGTQGVGYATTKSVVTSCILIVVGDYFLTKFFMVIEQWL
ncbi:MAG: ABC transporter permease [Bdellovibrionaceae bacterium]|nr:ABC transporter permease [Pseudobdellovibrionaceae bacterium]